MSNNSNRLNAVIVHGGGPSPVLNASLVGIVEGWYSHPGAGELFGARFGAHGLVAGDWLSLANLAPELLQRIRRAPGSVIGSSRQAFTEPHTEAALIRLRERS